MKSIKAIIVVLALTLPSCSVWDIINPFDSGGGLSVDAELTVGDKTETISTEVVGKKETTMNTADSINNTYQTINEQYPFWVVTLLVLGWVLDSPSVLWQKFSTRKRAK